MTKLTPHDVVDREINRVIAMVHPASRNSVDLVLSQSEDDEEGRSNWVWVRLANGDLILGVYPQGGTYELVEIDAKYPGEKT